MLEDFVLFSSFGLFRTSYGYYRGSSSSRGQCNSRGCRRSNQCKVLYVNPRRGPCNGSRGRSRSRYSGSHSYPSFLASVYFLCVRGPYALFLRLLSFFRAILNVRNVRKLVLYSRTLARFLRFRGTLPTTFRFSRILFRAGLRTFPLFGGNSRLFCKGVRLPRWFSFLGSNGIYHVVFPMSILYTLRVRRALFFVGASVLSNSTCRLFRLFSLRATASYFPSDECD